MISKSWRTALRAASFAVLSSAIAPVALAQLAYDTSLFRTQTYRHIGPFRGGRATTGVGVSGDSLTYYMGATGGGLWKTDNAGQTWRNISDGHFRTGSIGDIAVSPSNPAILYVGTGEAPVRMQMSSYGDGVYKSSDTGRTWRKVGLEQTRQIARVVVHPTNSNTVYVAAQGSRWGPTEDRGIYRSTDGGSSWTKVLFVSPIAGAAELQMDPAYPLVLYATFWDYQRTPWSIRSGGPGSGIWKTSDGGDTWRQLKNGLPAMMGKIRLAVAPSNSNRVYATVEYDSSGMFRSDDAGETWRAVAPNQAGIFTRPWYYMGVAVDPGNPDVVYVSGAYLLKSVDGGATYTVINTPHVDTHTLWINPRNPLNMINTDDGGASISFNGGSTWSPIDNQPTAQFYFVQADDRFPYRLYGGQQDAGPVVIPHRTYGAGITRTDWSSGPGGESARFAFDPKDPTLVFGTNYMGIIESRNEKTGMTRGVGTFPGQHLGYTASQMRYRYNWSAPLTWSPFDHTVMYHGANRLMRSVNEGNTWVPMSPDLTRNDRSRQGRSGLFWHDGSGGEVYNTLLSIAPSRLVRGEIWAGTDDGLVHLTRDDGKTWTEITPDRREGMIGNIEVSPHDRGTAYVVYSRHRWNDPTPFIFRTTDYGRTWTNVARTFPQAHHARAVREDPKRRGLLYAATEYGVWISFNSGASWQSFQRNLPMVPVSDLIVHHDDLVVATEGRGFWVMDDLTPLHQMAPAMSNTALVVFKPRAVTRVAGAGARAGGGGGGGGGGGAGGAAAAAAATARTAANPPYGAVIHYFLRDTLATGDTLKLAFADSAGTVIHRFSTPSATPAVPDTAAGAPVGGARGGPPPVQLTAHSGVNEFAWDLRAAPVPGATGAGAAQQIPSGRYTVRMTLGATTVAQPIEIISDPRTRSTRATETMRYQHSRSLATSVGEMNAALQKLRSVRAQLDSLAGRLRAAPVAERDGAIRTLVAGIDSVERQLVVPAGGPAGPGGQLVLHTGSRLLSETSGLQGTIENGSGPVTEGERWETVEYARQWRSIKAVADRLLSADLDRVNALLGSSGITQVKRP
jgi:photosystem II stability/assembly factor-like uncharacterized protein